MANQHLDASEIVAGLCLEGKLSPMHVPLPALYPPYEIIVGMLLDSKDEASVVSKVGILPVQAAKAAAQAVSDKPALEWVDILVQASQREEMAMMFEREAKKMRAGNDPDISKISGLMEQYKVREGRYVTMDQVSDEEISWVRTWYEPIDRHFGSFQNKDNCGLPEAQVVVVGAPPGTGKTTLLVKLMALQAMHKRKALMYELEMTRQQITRRTIEVAALAPQYRKNIYICDEILTPAEIFVEASRMVSSDPDISMIAVDYMSLSVEEEDEPTITRAYKLMQRLAKNTRRPVIVLSQLSGAYTGSIPMINHLRYSRMIEALAGMVFLLYNPAQVFSSMGKDSRLPIVDGRAYLIAGKSKFGYREGGTGAVQVDFNPAKGWGDESLGWFPLTGVGG